MSQENISELRLEFENFLDPSSTKSKRKLIDFEVISRALAEIALNTQSHGENAQENIWRLSLPQRQSMMAKWKSEINPALSADQIVELHLRHQKATSDYREAVQELDAKCLETMDVIGITTTACASNWSLLSRLNLEVVICEEAGEVMEAHTVCTLFPSVEHAIFIGDPLQLRSQVTEQALSLDTRAGQDYRLDESLFERFMYPTEPRAAPIPTSQLSVQRRMHAEIADLSRATLYPYLKDHSSTTHHPAVIGLEERTFWFDHRVPEDDPDSVSTSSKKSFSNSYEVQMVIGLVRYLVKSNAYGLGDIAVLTPYNGQLAALVGSLHSTCSVWLSDQDRETLFDDGLLDDSVAGTRTDVDMMDMLRVATM